MSKSKIQQQLRKLSEWFSHHQGTITAFSGGIDSGLVLYLSQYFLGSNALGCISISPSLKRKDYAEAIAFCAQYNIQLEVIETREIEDENYLSNPANRCYYCKSHLYTDLNMLQKKYKTYSVLNGTNADDFGDYRPGIQAADEHGIQTPLADCGLNKADVRAMAKYFGLPNWNKPASPCLSSRVPYGKFITPEKLNQIEQAELSLNKLGFDEVRVRHYGDKAKIEVPKAQVASLISKLHQIDSTLKSLGFKNFEVDKEGLVSGKLNRVLQKAGKIHE